MKATADCPKCGGLLETDCRGCIDGNGCECAKGECNCEFEEGTEIKWKKIPENEKELLEVEEQ